MPLEPATFRGSCGTGTAPGTAGFQCRPLGSFWRQPSLALSVGASAGGEGPPFGETGSVSARKSLETLKLRTPGSVATCSGSGKNLKPRSAASLSERTVVARTPEMLPKYRMVVPIDPLSEGWQFPGQATENGPRCACLWRDSTGRRAGSKGYSPLAASFSPRSGAAVSWSVGGYRRQPLERLWLQPPPPLVGREVAVGVTRA